MVRNGLPLTAAIYQSHHGATETRLAAHPYIPHNLLLIKFSSVVDADIVGIAIPLNAGRWKVEDKVGRVGSSDYRPSKSG
jgi:hypothetical protein